MRLTSATVSSYKSFGRAQTFTFGPGFNVVFGRNNAGKTALLEALSLNLTNLPHRSGVTVPDRGPAILSTPSVSFEFQASRDEVLEILSPLPWISVPLPPARSTLLNSHEEGELLRFCRWVLDQDGFSFQFYVTLGHQLSPARLPSFGLYDPQRLNDPNQLSFARCKVNNGTVGVPVSAMGDAIDREFGFVVARVFRESIYLFRAERRVARAPVAAAGDALAADASNLASMLDVLQANRARFDRFVRLVAEVLTDVRGISVRPVGTEREILVWFDDPEAEREDLAFPITDAGTGTGQVLAVLYLLHTATTGRTILIDEPQSFLHPGAVRNLIAVAKRFPQHQFIVTTHSPAVIASADPSTLHHLQLVGRESVATVVDVAQADNLRALLSDVGATLAEVFGAERVLWVEGATEEICFPLVMTAGGVSLLGTAIVGVKATGDFERRHSLVFDLYERVTAATIIPPALAFVFDPEFRTSEQNEDLVRRGKGKVHLLPRPMYENYLLNSRAVAAVANSIPGFSPVPISDEDVEKWIRENWEKYRRGSQTDFRQSVHGAALLAAFFAKLSDARVEYNKTTHGVALTRWIVQNDPSWFDELSQFLRSVISP